MDKRTEINDLIGDAVNNAVARRNQLLDSEDDLLALSDEELASVVGGKTKDIAVAGFKPCVQPPATVGLVAVDNNKKLAQS